MTAFDQVSGQPFLPVVRTLIFGRWVREDPSPAHTIICVLFPSFLFNICFLLALMHIFHFLSCSLLHLLFLVLSVYSYSCSCILSFSIYFTSLFLFCLLARFSSASVTILSCHLFPKVVIHLPFEGSWKSSTGVK